MTRDRPEASPIDEQSLTWRGLLMNDYARGGRVLSRRHPPGSRTSFMSNPR